MQVRSLDWEDPLEKGMETHSSILFWRILWSGEPGWLQFMRSQRVGHDSSDLACTHALTADQRKELTSWQYWVFLFKNMGYFFVYLVFVDFFLLCISLVNPSTSKFSFKYNSWLTLPPYSRYSVKHWYRKWEPSLFALTAVSSVPWHHYCFCALPLLCGRYCAECLSMY